MGGTYAHCSKQNGHLDSWCFAGAYILDTRYVRLSYQVYVDAVPHTISTSSVRESIMYLPRFYFTVA